MKMLQFGMRIWDSSVSTVSGYGVDDGGLIPDRGKIFLSSLQRPDRIGTQTAFFKLVAKS
jgi:hypothetical protein